MKLRRNKHNKKGETVDLQITITVVPVGDGEYIAATMIQGVPLRGPIVASAHGAVRALFNEMGVVSNTTTGRDAETALAMALGSARVNADLKDSTVVRPQKELADSKTENGDAG